jgi:uncharacterized protein (DUF433 family)
MSISKKSIIGEAESKGKYLDTDALDRLSQITGEGQKRFKIVDLIKENSRQIIDQAINDYVQINRFIKQLDNDQTSILIQKLDIIFRFVTYAFVAENDVILNLPESHKTYLELKDRVDYATEIISSMKFLTVDYINNGLVKNSIDSDIAQYSNVIAELENYFDKVILTLQEVGHNSENQPMRILTPSPIHSDPEVMGGILVFRNTRVPIQTLVDYLDDGFSLEEFLDNFPSVDRRDALFFLELARGKDN